jgi:hypothetical protein
MVCVCAQRRLSAGSSTCRFTCSNSYSHSGHGRKAVAAATALKEAASISDVLSLFTGNSKHIKVSLDKGQPTAQSLCSSNSASPILVNVHSLVCLWTLGRCAHFVSLKVTRDDGRKTMNSDQVPNSLVQQVSRLEKRSRLLVRLNLFLVVVVCLMLPAGWKFYREAMSGVVDCRSLALRDAGGQIQARLGVKGDEPALELYDARGKVLWSAPAQVGIMPVQSSLPLEPVPVPAPASNPQTVPEGPEPPIRQSRSMQVKAKLDEGDFRLRRGEYELAIAAYQEGLKLDPSNAELRHQLEMAVRPRETENEMKKKAGTGMAQ